MPSQEDDAPPPFAGVGEATQSPEILATQLIERVERGLSELHVPPRDQREWGWCNFVPDAVTYCAIQDGKENGYQVQSLNYLTKDLHRVAAGVVPDRNSEDYAKFYQDTFAHQFNVLVIKGKPFLVDLTFSQFVGPNGNIWYGAKGIDTDISNDHPLAQQLLHAGFAPLTNENLQDYLRMTTISEDKSYIGNVTTDLFTEVQPRPFDPEDNEVMEVPPAYK